MRRREMALMMIGPIVMSLVLFSLGFSLGIHVADTGADARLDSCRARLTYANEQTDKTLDIVHQFEEINHKNEETIAGLIAAKGVR